MNATKCSFLASLGLFCALALILSTAQALAANYKTTVTQASGQNWSAAIWDLGDGSALVSPAPGNTYECDENGTPFGNNLSNTRLRNPAAAGVQTFPGDSLTLNANTEIRAKTAGAILNFPGTNGLPGLILNGGVLNAGDDAVFVITGAVKVASTSYIVPGDNGGGAVREARGFNIAGQLSGNGNLVIYQAGTTVAQEISGSANTYTGNILVKAGWLKGSGFGSLGTGNITIDPLADVGADSSVTPAEGPAWLEVGYDIASPGTLKLINSGQMILHQNCRFSAVVIEGTSLSAGPHSYAELAAAFPNNFAAGGSGGITVGLLPPHYTTTVTQGSGQNWNGAIWSPGLVAPTNGATYECLSNGIPFGNALANTRIRNPASAGLQTFPGDSLTLNANTEIRAKTVGAILNFPGVGGLPGLILHGGILNAGDDTVFAVTGIVQVASTSYIVPADNGGGAIKPLRGFNISGQLTGSGTLVIYQAGTNVAQELSGNANTFTGDIVVKAGWLKGSGTNSLGTGNILIDPKALITVDASVTPVEGPAWLEIGYDINSPGTLTLQNGGQLILHQSCTFAKVMIEGISLLKGTHTYAELAAAYPTNFAAGGSGSITVLEGPGHYTTTVTQASGQNWTAAIWDLGDGSPLASPTGGNTYETLENGTPFGNNLANTRIRNPAAAGVQTFPGDVLTLNTNTEIRCKTANAILNFPGVGGNPGLILKGGVLNAGDDAVFVITGKVQVASTSFIVPGDNGGGNVLTARGINIAGQLSGSGDLVIYQAGTNVAQEISGSSNTYTGNILVKAGWLKGSGYGSLGSGNITIDPLLTLELDPSIVPAEGPAQLEAMYDIASPGTLTLINGGQMILHQNCTFAAVVIEGTSLSKGLHSYAELAAAFPNNFATGGSGGITVGVAPPHYTTMVTQGSGQNWNGTIWSPGLVAPTNGATYECLSNGIPFGNTLANTRIRNPASAGLQTFPGDSLTLNANTEIRAKTVGAILNFPGVGGLPGLILRGGVLNAGDDTVFGLTGIVQVASTSYIVPGDNGAGAVKPLRGFNISGQLTGAGTLVIYQAGTNVAQELSGNANTFTGDIVVKAGWLKGSGTNSLGTGNLLIDPKAVIAVDASVTPVEGPAWLEIGYDINSPGRLMVQNGGQLILHQNCTFSKIMIEGVTLLKGIHTYAELAAAFPANFIAGGSGSITALEGPLHYTTSITQAGGQNWNAAIWDLGDGSPLASPSIGNTYETLENGTPFGNNLANTRIRNPAAAGVQTFPGDVLTLNTNTEIRCKAAGAILDFPGVGGKPGLILKGGVLNAGDDAVFVITGKVQIASTSFIVPGDNGGGNVMPARGINIAGQLSGNGTLIIYQAGTNVAQEISGNQNTYTGDIKVKAGWLRGSGTNSLGMGNITIDPLLPLELDPSIVPAEGPAQLEVTYDIVSPGTLTLANGGQMILHQNCRFAAMVIEGTTLSNGPHTYAELAAAFPNNFAAAGSGGISIGAAFIPQPQLAQPVMIGADFQASFQSYSGAQYQVQYKDDLAATSWTPLTTITGDGAVKTFTDAGAQGKSSKRFYRILVP